MSTYKDKYKSDPDFKKRMQERARESRLCSCGVMVTASNLSKHRNTKKHIRLLEEKKNYGINDSNLKLLIKETLKET